MTWAHNAGYKTKIVGDSNSYPGSVKTSYKGNVPALQAAFNVIHEIEQHPLIEILANDLTILAWNWNPTNGGGRFYKYFVLSKAGEILCNDPSTSSFWFRYFPFFSQIQEDTVCLQLPTDIASLQASYDEVHSLALGGTHFGHWVADTVPQFLLADELSYTDPYLFTVQSHAEAGFLRRLLRRPMRGVSINLAGIRMALIKVPFARLFSNFSVSQRNSLLRARVSSTLEPSQSTPISKGCYIVRGRVDNIERISNEHELINIAIKFGLDIIQPTNHPFYSLPQIFRDYTRFVYFNSSVNTNFNVLASNDSTALALLSDEYKNCSEEIVLGSGIYMLPRIDKIKPVIVGQSHPTNNLDRRFAIDLDRFSSHLEQFLADKS